MYVQSCMYPLNVAIHVYIKGSVMPSTSDLLIKCVGVVRAWSPRIFTVKL